MSQVCLSPGARGFFRCISIPRGTRKYMLVAAADADGQAWVEISAGIDVPVGMLQLS